MRQPLPCLLIKSFFYGKGAESAQPNIQILKVDFLFTNVKHHFYAISEFLAYKVIILKKIHPEKISRLICDAFVGFQYYLKASQSIRHLIKKILTILLLFRVKEILNKHFHTQNNGYGCCWSSW